MAVLVIGGLCLLAAALAYTIRGSASRHEDTGASTQRGELHPAASNRAKQKHAPAAGISMKPVGTAVCAACHSNQHQSYLLTAHSRAMTDVNPDTEPPDGNFFHALSKRYYSVYRQDGKLWHAESGAPLEAATASAAVPDSGQLVREPVKYLVGSGRHSRTYLVEQDGFLMESPITWYSSTREWNMSPGYDHAQHVGFERSTDLGCLVCHVGQAELIEGALNRLLISETAIGCERCHGPGSAHIAKWKDRPPASLDETHSADESIVHPERLSRDLKEAICSQCHLRGDATVVQRGKSVSDFHPGTALTDIRIDYHLENDNGGMKVVGHADQMHSSRCYQQTSTLTCTTCHDSHAEQLPDPESGYYRNKCIECHGDAGCSLSPSERLQQNASDNCVQCHMPQVPTDIPHIAFTHHRIGVHTSMNVDQSTDDSKSHLVPFGDVSGLAEIERQRCLGLAYAELTDRQSVPNAANEYRGQAIRLLQTVADSNEADGDVFAALARFAWEEQNPSLAMNYAKRALANRDLSAKARVNSLLIVGDCYLQAKQSALAVAPLEQLVKLRRNSEDWLLLGISRFQSGQRESGIAAVKQATLIQPFRADLHSTLAEMQRAAQ